MSDSTFLSYDQLINKFSLNPFPFTIYNGVIAAIPRLWKQNLDIIVCSAIDIPVNNQPASSRFIYSNLISPLCTQPRALVKWEHLFNTDLNWQSIFLAPFASLRETKLQYFQLRFLHRILGTNSYLFRLHLRNDSLCSFCGIEDESIDHLFWNCEVVSNFILDVELSFLGRIFVFSKQDIFFGYKLLSKHPYNFLIFHLKYYLYGKKLDSEPPLLIEFTHKFRFALQVEKYIISKYSTRCIPFKDFENAFCNCKFLFL